MRSFFSKLRYWGYDRDTYLRQLPELDRRNLSMLKQTSMLMTILSGAASLICYFLLGDLVRTVIATIVTPMFLYVHLFCAGLCELPKLPSHRTVTGMIFLMWGILSAFTIYLGTVSSDGDLAVTAILMLLVNPIFFDVSPVLSAAMTFPAGAAFILCSFLTKAPDNTAYDVLHAFIAITVGLFFSYKKSRLTMENIIADGRLKLTNYALYHASVTDELTGLPNRRQVFDCMEQLKQSCIEHDTCLACVVLDLDDYKAYNDLYGHPAGDRLLKRLGVVLTGLAAESGITIGRIGGEEFMAVWEEKDPDACEQVAEQIRRTIEELKIQHLGSAVSDVVTVSTGVSVVKPAAADRVYSLADRALYCAKGAGKNRSYRCVSPEEDLIVSGPIFPVRSSDGCVEIRSGK